MANLVVERDLVVGLRVRIGLTTGGVFDARHVAMVDHGMHAGQGSGRRVVDRDDSSMGVGTAQNLGVQKIPHLEVIGEGRVALHQPECVDLHLGLTHDSGDRYVRRRNDARDGGRTDRWIVLRVVDSGVDAVSHRFDHQGAEGFCLLASENCCRLLDCRHRLHVGRLAVENARKHVPDLVLVGVRVPVEQGEGSQHHGTGRIARLHRSCGSEGRLDGMEVAVGVQGLHRGDRMTVGLCRQDDLRARQPTIDEYSRGPGLARG